MIRWERDRLCLSGSLFLCSENLRFGLENSKAMFFSAPHSICSSEAEHSHFFPWRQLGIHLWMFTLIFLLGEKVLMVSGLWCVKKSEVRLGSPASRKIKMVIGGKTQALAKGFPPWTFAVWYWNVFTGSGIFQKTNQKSFFHWETAENLWKIFVQS